MRGRQIDIESKGTGTNELTPIRTFRCFRELVCPGVLGIYTGCEVFNIFFQEPSVSTTDTFNLYTLVNFGDFPSSTMTKKLQYLNRERLRIRIEDRDFVFGALYFRVSLLSFAWFYRRFLRNRKWDLSGSMLLQNANLDLPREYVPSDGSFNVPINSILKNNFFGGSYLIEHFDPVKNQTELFRNNPTDLSDISEKLSLILPMKIAENSERLGGIILQFPNEMIRSEFLRNKTLAHIYDVHIKRGARCSLPTNDLFAMVSREGARGEYLHGFGVDSVKTGVTNICVDNTEGVGRHLIFSRQHRLIMGAFKGTEIEGINLSMNLASERVRLVPTEFGLKRVSVSSNSLFNAGRPIARSVSYWESEALHEKERFDLARQRSFVQYGFDGCKQRSEALGDLVELIQKYGQQGAWICDPYLTASDILETLFLCPFGGTDLRAIGSMLASNWTPYGSGKGIKVAWKKAWWSVKERFRKTEEKRMIKLNGFRYQQAAIFDSLPREARVDLTLQFRIQHGIHGWRFHDRFLIFPRRGSRPKAWSLGTSINSVGRHYHILHEVSHASLVMESFERMWEALADPECHVWSSCE